MLSVAGLSKSFDGVRALDDFAFELHGGEILGLIGPNGAGKTTLFNVITGFIAADRGKVLLKNNDITGLASHQLANGGIARTFQELRLIRQLSVLDNVLLSFRGQPGESMANVFFRPKRCRQYEAGSRPQAIRLLKKAGITEKADDPADNLSYGEQKLLSLVCCLAADADLLLLDEPVAGIASEMAERILTIIADLPKRGKSAIVIEHDIDALKSIAHRMIFMDAGRKICEGTPNEILNDPRVIEAYLD